jgi:hypothetical protein
MSRIHEALKRAEQERAQARTGSVTARAEAPQALAAVEAAEPETAPILNTMTESGNSAAPWSFEALSARRQPHPLWNPDQEMDVFDAG